MVTINQLCGKNRRIKKVKKSKTPALKKNPQVKGVCIKVVTKSPKKPNSAVRKVTKLKLSNKKKIESYIPGEGHNLRQYSTILIRGGRTPDLPGLKYKNIRGKYDFQGLNTRLSSRSKYGTKSNKKK